MTNLGSVPGIARPPAVLIMLDAVLLYAAMIHLKAEVKENEPQVNQSDADAAEAMKKLATNPELMQLLIKLSKSM